MAEFQEVMRHWKRMCGEMDAKYMDRCCEKCPLEGRVCGTIYVMEESTDWKSMEKEIMAWAKEHPEQVYPTWYEALVELGVIAGAPGDVTLGEYVTNALLTTRVDAGTAPKLGIEPETEA